MQPPAELELPCSPVHNWAANTGAAIDLSSASRWTLTCRTSCRLRELDVIYRHKVRNYHKLTVMPGRTRKFLASPISYLISLTIEEPWLCLWTFHSSYTLSLPSPPPRSGVRGATGFVARKLSAGSFTCPFYKHCAYYMYDWYMYIDDTRKSPGVPITGLTLCSTADFISAPWTVPVPQQSSLLLFVEIVILARVVVAPTTLCMIQTIVPRVPLSAQGISSAWVHWERARRPLMWHPLMWCPLMWRPDWCSSTVCLLAKHRTRFMILTALGSASKILIWSIWTVQTWLQSAVF